MFRMKRRKFIALIAGAAAAWPLAVRAQQPGKITRYECIVTLPFAASAQQPAMPVIGFLRDSTAAGSEFTVNGLRKGLAEAGFVEGRNLTIEYAWTDGRSERLSALAAELVGRHVPVIVSNALNAAKSASGTKST